MIRSISKSIWQNWYTPSMKSAWNSRWHSVWDRASLARWRSLLLRQVLHWLPGWQHGADIAAPWGCDLRVPPKEGYPVF